MWFKSSFTTPAVVAISFCLIGATSPAAADILHVPGDYPTIQEAIDAAVDGDEVVVADAVYTGPNNKNLNFNGRLITVRSENGPANCIIDCEDDGRGFVFNSGETATATVQGFTIKNGGLLQYPFGVPGGGIYIVNSSPTVTNCRIIACFAIPTGGGLYSSGGSPIITDCFFSQNVACVGDAEENGWGGGMYLQGGSPVVTNCDFLNGRAEGVCSGFGGGVYNRNSSPTFIDCTFGSNLARATAGCVGNDQAGGGGMYNRNSDSLLINCTFNANQVSGDNSAAGGGMYNDPDSSPTLIDCAFTGNSASDFYGGFAGGLFSWSNSFVINCTFFGNVVGGGMEDGGGGAIGGNPTAVNCLFVNNDGANGGAVFSGAGTFINCVMADNSANIGGGFGGGPNATITNCIIWNNTPDQINGSPTVTYSDIEGGFPGTGNIDADPLFVIPGGNYRLSSGSPCIDAADNTAMPKNIDTDLDGNPRFIDAGETKDTGQGDCPIVDMGSYEFQEGTEDCCPWDLDGNNDVGVGDLLILLGAWGPNLGHPADFDGSGDVGVSDFLTLLANWGPCP